MSREIEHQPDSVGSLAYAKELKEIERGHSAFLKLIESTSLMRTAQDLYWVHALGIGNSVNQFTRKRRSLEIGSGIYNHAKDVEELAIAVAAAARNLKDTVGADMVRQADIVAENGYLPNGKDYQVTVAAWVTNRSGQKGPSEITGQFIPSNDGKIGVAGMLDWRDGSEPEYFEGYIHSESK